jgi:glutaredoxin
MRRDLSTTTVEISTRPSCSLCADARKLLEAARNEWGFSLVEHDILERSDWFRRFRCQVPVVVVGGVPRLWLHFSREELEVALGAALEEVSRRE